MKINVDHFMKMGGDHNVCEDYVISGADPFPYVILADGCSSGKDTDVGARILCYAAKRIIQQGDAHHYYRDLGFAIIHRANIVAELLQLNKTSLYSTLIVAYLEENRIVHVYMYGDGNILLKGKSGDVHYTNISFTQNAPYYLSYWVNKDDKEEYKAMGTHLLEGEESFNYDTKNHFSFFLSAYDSIMIASDGIESFNIPMESVAKDLLAFKSTKGRFVLRRARKMLREYKKNDIKHYDDFSVGGFHNE